VRWEGYNEKSDTWEPYTHVADTAALDKYAAETKGMGSLVPASLAAAAPAKPPAKPPARTAKVSDDSSSSKPKAAEASKKEAEGDKKP
jgi:hypothetical protein